MEMYSSESPEASFSACCMTQTNSFEGRMSGTVLPLRRGSASIASGARPRAPRVLAEPLQHRHHDASSCSSRASRRCAGATSGLECSEASR